MLLFKYFWRGPTILLVGFLFLSTFLIVLLENVDLVMPLFMVLVFIKAIHFQAFDSKKELKRMKSHPLTRHLSSVRQINLVKNGGYLFDTSLVFCGLYVILAPQFLT